MRWLAALCGLAAFVAVTGTAPAQARSPWPVHRFVFAGADPVVAPTAASPNPDCGGASTTPVSNDVPIIVSMPPVAPFTLGTIAPTVWQHPMTTDAGWRLQFEGFMYLSPLAERAAQDGQDQALTTMVLQLAEFHEQNPDPGTVAFGWDEGTAQRRLQTEDCLYSLTHNHALIPGMQADEAVQFGPRYYGPPYHPVHNHGLMANLRILRGGELLNRPGWVKAAIDRMASEAPFAFSPQGTSWEQSSGYQMFNVSEWNQAAEKLAEVPEYASNAASIRAVTAKGRRVAEWLTEPDGNYVQIGDSDDSSGIGDPTATGPVFDDPAAGYVIGRWSWSNPATTYYTIRFGPGRRAHGHFDRGSVTWSTLGSRILVGPGRYAYNSTAYATWRTTRAAQNVAIPATGTYDDRRSSTIIGSKVQAAAHAWTEQDNLYGSTHTRAVTVNAVAHTLRVTDSYAGTALFHQLWHLDPAWHVVSAPANAKQLVFHNTVNGRTLTITTTGLLSSVVRGQMSPVAGYTSPTMDVLTPDCQVTLRSTGGAVTTTFAVS